MIEQLQLQNFRGFEEHTIPLKQLSLIVGANNAGKSTLVEALRLVSLVIRGIGRFAPEPAWLDHELAYRGVAPSTRNLDLDEQSFFHRYEPPPAVVQARFASGCEVNVFVGPEGALHGVIRDPGGHAVGSAPDARALRLPQIAVQPQVAPLLRKEATRTRPVIERAVGSYLSPQHFRNQLRYFYEHFPAFCALAETSWPEFQIDRLEWPDSRPGDLLELKIRESDFYAEVAWMGHGLQMWLQTMWFLAQTRSTACVILDEPDVYMHPDTQHRLLDAVRDRFAQLLVTTHSVELIATVDPSDILIIDRRAERSDFATSLPAVQAAIERAGSVHQLELVRLWTADRFMLLEGKDREYFRVFERTLKIRPQFVDTTPRGSTGGWGGWSLSIESKLPATNNNGARITTYAIFDSDYRTPAEIEQRYQEAESRGIRLHVWHRKEIENYLLVPAAIARHLASLTGNGSGPTEAEVQARLLELAESLRDEIEIGIAEELHKIDKAGGTPKAMKAAKARVKSAFESVDGVVGIVPGKRMLKMLSDWSNSEYGVTFGPSRLAYVLEPSEIDNEVKDVLRAVATTSRFPGRLRARPS